MPTMRQTVLIAILLGLALASCDQVERAATPGDSTVFTDSALNTIRYYYDKEHRVHCWYVAEAGISCLPDAQVAR